MNKNPKAEIMKLLSWFLLLFLLLLSPGCARVPRTEVRFDPRTHALSVRSPKDIEITNLTATISNNVVMFTVGGYRSVNNAAVITAIARQNADTMAKIAELGGQMIGEAAKHAK
jgi:hypothetical protein